MASLWNVKLVPNDTPNADGHWFCIRRHEAPKFDDDLMPGRHVVAVERNIEQPFYMHSGPPPLPFPELP